MQRLMFWGLFCVTAAVYGTMLGWSLPTISGAAGGLVPFDMRPGGYDFSEALAFVSALTGAGASFYLDVQQKLDIAYPALISLTLFFAIAALLPSRLGRWRWVVAALVLPVAGFDYLENHAVAMMIEAGPNGLTADLVATASMWTVLKSSASMLAMTSLLILLVVRTIRAAFRLWQAKGVGFVSRRPVLSFLVLAYVMSWSVQFLAARLGLPMFALSSLGVVLGLAIPAMLITAATGGRAALSDLFHRWLRWRVSPVWYAVAGLGLLAAMVGVASAFEGMAPVGRLLGSGAALLVDFLPELVLGFVFIQLFEELAWTGFLQHRLLERHGPLLASVMVAPAFALSHLMINYLERGDAGAALVLLAVQIVFSIFFRIVITWFYSGSGNSVLIVALFHAAFNISNGKFASDLTGGSLSSLLPLATVAAVAILVGAGMSRRPRVVKIAVGLSRDTPPAVGVLQ